MDLMRGDNAVDQASLKLADLWCLPLEDWITESLSFLTTTGLTNISSPTKTNLVSRLHQFVYVQPIYLLVFKLGSIDQLILFYHKGWRRMSTENR